MLHGGAMTFESSFGAVIGQLGADRPVIGVEQQGHGHTPLNGDTISLETMRSDTLAVLDHLGVQRAHVVGLSAGGMLGLELAVNAPDRVASLTAISASQNSAGMRPDPVRMQKDPAFVPPPEIAALMPSAEDCARMASDITRLNILDRPELWAMTQRRIDGAENAGPLDFPPLVG